MDNVLHPITKSPRREKHQERNQRKIVIGWARGQSQINRQPLEE
jgi:hypothetical protein